jgi:hypothetical protein
MFSPFLGFIRSPLGLLAGVAENTGLACALAGAAIVALPAALVDDDLDGQGLVGAVDGTEVARGTRLGHLRCFDFMVAAAALDPEILEILRVGHVELGGVVLVVAGPAVDLEIFEVRLVGEHHLADGRFEEENLLRLLITLSQHSPNREKHGDEDCHRHDRVFDPYSVHDTSLDEAFDVMPANYQNFIIS